MDKDDLPGVIYLGIFTGFMISVTIYLHGLTQEQLREMIPLVVPFATFGFLAHFGIRMKLLKNKFSKYQTNYPVKLNQINHNLAIQAFHTGVFFAAELFGIFTLSMSIFFIGLGTADENFAKLQFWDYFSTFWIFPFLGQIIPLLIKMDNKADKESKEKAAFITTHTIDQKVLGTKFAYHNVFVKSCTIQFNER